MCWPMQYFSYAMQLAADGEMVRRFQTKHIAEIMINTISEDNNTNCKEYL